MLGVHQAVNKGEFRLETVAQATTVLNDRNQLEERRVAAAHFLGDYGTEESAAVLVSALDDDDPGVRWAASEALAKMGDLVMPALLRAMVQPHCSLRLIDGAKHVFHNSSSDNVRAETTQLLQTMHGSSQSVAVMSAASALMTKLHIQ